MTTDAEQAEKKPRARGASVCSHDGGELVAYDEANPAKAGRVHCVECNCSFAGGVLVTAGARCRAD